MKAKIILYGWVISLLPMMGGLGTMEWAMETGDPVMLRGMGLFMVWVIFSLLVIRNRKIIDEEVKRFEDWFNKMFIHENKQSRQDKSE